MTQPTPGAIVATTAATNPTPEAEQPDEIQRILNDLENDIRRFRNSPLELQTVAHFMSRTVVEYIKDALNQIKEVRDYAVDIDEDLRKLEKGAGDEESETQLLPEHAEKFTALIEGVVMIIAMITGSGQQAPDTMKALGELKQIADDCRKIIQESTLEVDDEEEEEEEDDEPGEKS